jgi:hypothetical protein
MIKYKYSERNSEYFTFAFADNFKSCVSMLNRFSEKILTKKAIISYNYN